MKQIIENKLNPRTIGYNLKIAREELNLTQEYVAKQMGMHVNTISKLEAGMFKKLDIELLGLLSELYNTNSENLITGNHMKTFNINGNNNNHQVIGNVEKLENDSSIKEMIKSLVEIGHNLKSLVEHNSEMNNKYDHTLKTNIQFINEFKKFMKNEE